MIKELTVKNFKSIKNLQIDCKRVNLFIGDPNSGKSNILESLALLNNNNNIKDFIRVEQVSQLFFDFDSSEAIEIMADNYRIRGTIDENVLIVESFLGLNSPFLIKMDLNANSLSTSSNDSIRDIPKIRFYHFSRNLKQLKAKQSFLEPPHGSNIASVVLSNKELRTQVQVLLEGLDLKLLFKPNDSDFEVYKEHAGFSISFPISVISDTVRRMIFYLAAIESNQNATIVFEEPESNTFPLYIKYLAERVAAYSKNQYFITTHNPYFLQSIIEKTPTNDLSINLVEMEDYQTKVTTLTEKGAERILDLTSDVFLNFESLKEV